MGVSFQELILLMMIGLIVLGPERLPRVANQVGRWLGQARRMTRVMKRQLEDELNLERQYDMLPPARTRHSTPGTYQPPPADSSRPAANPVESTDEEKDDTFSPAHGADEPGTGVSDDPVATDETERPAGDDDSPEPGNGERARDSGGKKASA